MRKFFKTITKSIHNFDLGALLHYLIRQIEKDEVALIYMISEILRGMSGLLTLDITNSNE